MRLLIVLLRLLLVALALGNVHLGVLDHLVHHRNDAGAALSLPVLTEGLGAHLCERSTLLLHELLLLLRGLLVQRGIVKFVHPVLGHAEELHRSLVRSGSVDRLFVLLLALLGGLGDALLFLAMPRSSTAA